MVYDGLWLADEENDERSGRAILMLLSYYLLSAYDSILAILVSCMI